MIIVQTPLRVSLFGGGTDFPAFYLAEGGCVVTTAINKYIFVVIKARFDQKLRIGYSRTEMVDSVEEIQHELIREALRKVGISQGVEIATLADVPAAGSGLGSSSAVTVGALHAMYSYRGELVEAERLAEEACEIEVETLGKPIGVQDQYIAALGGLRYIEFGTDGRVRSQPLEIDAATRRRLSESLTLFYTGTPRRADTILAEQRGNIPNRLGDLRRMRDMALTAKEQLLAGNPEALGHLLHESWQLKKRLASRISNGEIDGLYERARRAGALGGKITGAGGGGFLLLYCPNGTLDAVRRELSGLQELPFRLERDGTKVILNYRR
jgi:D-glycero-alpha-D-manno-heptose-7-phosphate kinase